MPENDRDAGYGFPPAPDPCGGDDDGPATTTVNLPPWEDRTRHSLLTGFLHTIPQVMTAPDAFFTDHPTRRGLWGPVSFGVLMGVVSSVAGWIWAHALTGFERDLLERLGEDYRLSPEQVGLTDFAESFGVLASPLLALISVFVVAGLVHLGVKLAARAPDRGFEATLRATAYAGAASILSLIPICGSGVGNVWMLVIAVIGLRRLHGLGTGAALIAVLGPLLLCGCGCAGLFVLLTGLGAS